MQQNQYQKNWQVLSVLHRGIKAMPNIEPDSQNQQDIQATIIQYLNHYNKVMEQKIAQMNIYFQQLNLKIHNLFVKQKKLVQVCSKISSLINHQFEHHQPPQKKGHKQQKSQLKKSIEKNFTTPKKNFNEAKTTNSRSTNIENYKIQAPNQHSLHFKELQCEKQQSHLHRHILFLQNQLKNLTKNQQKYHNSISKKLYHNLNQSNDDSQVTKLQLENKALKDKLNVRTRYLNDINLQVQKAKLVLAQLSQPCQFCGLKAKLLSQIQIC